MHAPARVSFIMSLPRWSEMYSPQIILTVLISASMSTISVALVSQRVPESTASKVITFEPLASRIVQLWIAVQRYRGALWAWSVSLALVVSIDVTIHVRRIHATHFATSCEKPLEVHSTPCQNQHPLKSQKPQSNGSTTGPLNRRQSR